MLSPTSNTCMQRISSVGSAALLSTSPSCLSRRPHTGFSASSRNARARLKRRSRVDHETAHPAVALGALGSRPDDRGLHFLRPADTDLDRPEDARMDGRVSGQAPLTRKLPACDNICALMTRYVYDFDEPSD